MYTDDKLILHQKQHYSVTQYTHYIKIKVLFQKLHSFCKAIETVSSTTMIYMYLISAAAATVRKRFKVKLTKLTKLSAKRDFNTQDSPQGNIYVDDSI